MPNLCDKFDPEFVELYNSLGEVSCQTSPDDFYTLLNKLYAFNVEVQDEWLYKECLPYTNPEWYGFCETASGAENSQALLESYNLGKDIRLPSGTFCIDNTVFNIDDKSQDFVLKGQGTSATILETSGGTGVLVNINSGASQLQGDKNSINIEDLGFRSKVTGGNIGLHISDNSSAGDAGTSVMRTIDNVSFAGSTDTNYYGEGIRITDGSYFDIENVRGSGPEGSTGGILINILGDKNSVDNNIRNAKGRNFEYGVKTNSRNEGTVIADSNFVNVDYGVYSEAILDATETGQPWLRVSGGHIAAYKKGIYSDDNTQLMVNDTLIYLLADNSIGIDVLRSSATIGVSGSIYTNNSITSITGANNIGMRMGQYSGQSIISSNIINGMDIALQFLVIANQFTGGSNIFSNNNTNIDDNGGSNTVTFV